MAGSEAPWAPPLIGLADDMIASTVRSTGSRATGRIERATVELSTFEQTRLLPTVGMMSARGHILPILLTLC